MGWCGTAPLQRRLLLTLRFSFWLCPSPAVLAITDSLSETSSLKLTPQCQAEVLAMGWKNPWPQIQLCVAVYLCPDAQGIAHLKGNIPHKDLFKSHPHHKVIYKNCQGWSWQLLANWRWKFSHIRWPWIIIWSWGGWGGNDITRAGREVMGHSHWQPQRCITQLGH